jgi:hypothetical protein
MQSRRARLNSSSGQLSADLDPDPPDLIIIVCDLIDPLLRAGVMPPDSSANLATWRTLVIGMIPE